MSQFYWNLFKVTFWDLLLNWSSQSFCVVVRSVFRSICHSSQLVILSRTGRSPIPANGLANIVVNNHSINNNVSYLSESWFLLVASFRVHHASFFRPMFLTRASRLKKSGEWQITRLKWRFQTSERFVKLKKKHQLGAPLLHYPPEVAILTQPRVIVLYLHGAYLASNLKPEQVFIDLIRLF